MKSTRTQSLDALARRAARADAAAAAQLHERLHGGLVQFFTRRANGRTDIAEELAQATWTQAWRSLCEGRYDPDRAAFTTFIFAIGHKLWLRRGRGSLRTFSALDTDDPASVMESADESPESALHLGELLEALRACLDSSGLSEMERRIAVAISAGASEREIATELSLAPSTVNVRKKAAYDKLRQCLAGKGFSEAEQAPVWAEKQR